MIETLKNLINDKRILILGFGKEGKSTFDLLNKVGNYKQLDIADKLELSDNIADKHTLIIGDTYLDYINEYDIVFKSPGVVLPKLHNEYDALITSQTNIFLEAYSNQIIGITGTKGKSTTSTLLYHVLKNNLKDVILTGNIGIPFFDVCDEINENTIIVSEFSCHQLQYATNSPHISVLLNLYEDHLDYYKTFDNYVKAKSNIYIHQNATDILYCNKEFINSLDAVKSIVKVIDKEMFIYDDLGLIDGAKLKGPHNLLNATFVYNITKEFNISDDEFLSALKTYKPLAHRLELLGKLDDVDYYDDSISTTCESAISAIESIKNIDTILIGGLDRHIDYSILVDYLNENPVNNIILMYESGEKIYNMLDKKCANVVLVTNLYEAVEIAKEVTKKGGACVLSPAAASYGYFKNFSDRGDTFKKLLFE